QTGMTGERLTRHRRWIKRMGACNEAWPDGRRCERWLRVGGRERRRSVERKVLPCAGSSHPRQLTPRPIEDGPISCYTIFMVVEDEERARSLTRALADLDPD